MPLALISQKRIEMWTANIWKCQVMTMSHMNSCLRLVNKERIQRNPRRYIESNTGKSARQGKSPTPEGVRDFPVLHFLPVFDFISHFYQLFLVSCLFVNRASCKQCKLFPLHVNQNSSSVVLCIAWRLLCNNMADC